MVDSVGAEKRQRLMADIMATDQDLYWHIRAGSFDEWLRIDVTMPQLKTLIIVYGSPSGSMRMGQLAVALGVALSTATGIVDRLVEGGLLAREEDPEDRRLVVVRLTETGHETLEQPYRLTQQRFAAALSLISDEDLEALARSLRALHTAGLRAWPRASAEDAVPSPGAPATAAQ